MYPAFPSVQTTSLMSIIYTEKKSWTWQTKVQESENQLCDITIPKFYKDV